MKLLFPLAVVIALAATNIQAQRPLGSFTLKAPVTTGPVGFTTNAFKVECPGVIYTPSGGTGEIAVAYPAGKPVEVNVFYSGHGGTAWWDKNFPLADALLNKLLSQNHIVVMVRWKSSGWFGAPPTYRYGMEILACRPATTVKWIHDNVSQPRGIRLKLIGGSAGSAQIAYSFSSYWVDGYVDTAVLISGPPFAQIGRGCLQDGLYSYNQSETTMIDGSFGFVPGYTGPCTQHDPSWNLTWTQNSVNSGGTLYNWTKTRSILITGNHDSWEILKRAYDFRDQLRAAGEPIEHYPVATMGHSIQTSTDGLNLLFSLLTQ